MYLPCRALYFQKFTIRLSLNTHMLTPLELCSVLLKICEAL
jgi:hypothetical protein